MLLILDEFSTFRVSPREDQSRVQHQTKSLQTLLQTVTCFLVARLSEISAGRTTSANAVRVLAVVQSVFVINLIVFDRASLVNIIGNKLHNTALAFYILSISLHIVIEIFSCYAFNTFTDINASLVNTPIGFVDFLSNYGEFQIDLLKNKIHRPLELNSILQ